MSYIYKALNGLILLLIVSFLHCDTTEPPENKASLTLTLEDVSCTEAWITLKSTNLQIPNTIAIKQNDQIRITINLTSTDTLLYIDSLLPKHNYIYQVSGIGNPVSSNALNVTTMDTTSHNFTWQTFTFGQHSSSALYDVAIINENNIWAVGEIYMNDSLGNPDPHAYNAVHWNGKEWKLKRIMFYTICGQASLSSYPAKTIYAFNENDIWIAMDGDQIARVNGTSQVSKQCLPWSFVINKLWGSSSNNLYAVGNSGNIAHYNGSGWAKIESGTTLHLVDIQGNSKNEIFSAGVNIPEVKGVLLKGNGNQFSVMISSAIIDTSELFRTKLYGELASAWVDEYNTIYTGGNLLYHFKNNKWNYVTSLPENFIGGNPGTFYRGFIYSIRGNGSNDYIIAGDRNTLKHYNGIGWQQIGMPYSPSSSIIWFSVKQKGNVAVAVGDKDSKAFIILLKK